MASKKIRSIRVEGLDDVLEKLNAFIDDVPLKTKEGLIKAGLHIQRESQMKTPVDLGNLRASAFTMWKGKPAGSEKNFKNDRRQGARMSNDHQQTEAELKGKAQLTNDFWNPVVFVSYSAFYALYVHEDITKFHAVGEAKFLRRAMNENFDTILKLVKQENVKAIKRAGSKKKKTSKAKRSRGKI